jgi:hypothetical protein
VTDGTAPDDGSWTTTVAITSPFTISGTGTTGTTTIPNGNINYNPGTSCAVGTSPTGTDCIPSGPGTGTFTAGSATDFPASAGTFTAFSGGSLFGDTSVVWDPVITVTLDGSPAGLYTGTIEHSVTGT